MAKLHVSPIDALAKAMDVKQWFVAIMKPDFSKQDLETQLLTAPPEQVPTDEKPGPMKRWFSPVTPGGVRSAAIALTASALGSGALALPYAFSRTGVFLGLLLMFVAGIGSTLALQILMLASRYTKKNSYAELLELAGGCTAASIALDLIIVFNGLGAEILTLIFLGDFIPDIMRVLPFGLGGFEISRNHAIVAVALLGWPLTLPDKLSVLRYIAIAVPIALMFTTFTVWYDAPEMRHQVQAEGAELRFWRFEFKGFVQAFAIMVNSFTCQSNAVPVASEFVNPSVSRIVKSTVSSQVLVGVLLSLLGIGGYVSFLDQTHGDFLLNYGAGRPEIWLCRVGLGVIVFMQIPVSLLPTAKSMANLYLRVSGNVGMEISRKVHGVTATLILVGCTFVGLNVRDIVSVVSFIGGFLAASIMFWFPACVYRQIMWPVQPKYTRWPVLCLLVFFGSACWTSVVLNNLGIA